MEDPVPSLGNHLAHGLDDMTKEEMLALFQMLARRLNVQLMSVKGTPIPTTGMELIPNTSGSAATGIQGLPSCEAPSNADAIRLALDTDEARREQAAALHLVTDQPNVTEEEITEVVEDIVTRTDLSLTNRFVALQELPATGKQADPAVPGIKDRAPPAPHKRRRV